jgi:hypothetical protein
LENEGKILYSFIYFQVLLNQIVLGPCVIAVVFAWNNLWQGKLSQLPDKYQKDALPTLLSGIKRSLTSSLSWLDDELQISCNLIFSFYFMQDLDSGSLSVH